MASLVRQKQISEQDLRKQTRLTQDTPFAVRETYKIARTNIMFSIAGTGCKKVAMSSSYPGEGKTTTCTNLAMTFAQTGERVLIIDCDLRKPQVHNIFEINNAVGLSNILGGFVTPEEAIVRLEKEGLDIIPSGHIPPNPAELLASNEMKELLDKLETQYDYIFLDTPPINMVTDAVVLSKVTSGIILVARQEKSNHKDIQKALYKLEMVNAKLLGIMLTGEKRKGSSYGKYGKYGKYGNYKEYAAYE